jgi:hypothetical protein
VIARVWLSRRPSLYALFAKKWIINIICFQFDDLVLIAPIKMYLLLGWCEISKKSAQNLAWSAEIRVTKFEKIQN